MPDPLELIGAPRQRLPPITVDVTRGGIPESRHVVYGVLWDREGAAVAYGDAQLVTFLRSALKPFQALPLVVDGVAERIGLDGKALALACGSHSGQPEHLEVLQAMFEAAGADASMLRCGAHAPYHEPSGAAVGAGFDARHNNCSGKHAGMLAWTLAMGHDPEGYLEPQHPVQRRIASFMTLLSGVPYKEMAVGIDGCGVPTYGIALGHMARMFRFLSEPDAFLATGAVGSVPTDEADRIVSGLGRIRGAMAKHPALVGGTGRSDTEVIGGTEGRLVTKSGAEGLWCGAYRGGAFAFKAVDGGFRAVVPAALGALQTNAVLSDAEASRLAAQMRPAVTNRVGRAVGEIIAHLP